MKSLVISIIGWALIGGLQVHQATPPDREFEIKAVFLFNFAQFVEWPSESFNPGDAPLVIGVLGNNPFGDYLEATVKGETVEGHPLIVKHFNDIGEVEGCQMLFVNLGSTEQKDALNALKDKPVLTVGDRDDFVNDGGMIRFYMDNDRIHFEINVKATRDAKLQLSSKLLRLARLVND